MPFITAPKISALHCVCVFVAVLRLAGSLQKSTEVMKAMQSLIKVPEVQATMRELSKEMMKVSRDFQHALVQILYHKVIPRNGLQTLITL